MAEILSVLSTTDKPGVPQNGGAWYQTTSAFEADQSGNLLTTANPSGVANSTSVLNCYGDNFGGTNGGLDDVWWATGWTTSPTFNVTMGAAPGNEANGVSRARGGSGFKPVSYTHLTLPTILLV